MSGPATRRILEREYLQYGKPEYERLSTISVAHLYNLRQQPRYRELRLSYTRTRPTAVAIGERRCPDPQGQPGYLRVDTVHQGDAPAKASTTSTRWIRSRNGRFRFKAGKICEEWSVWDMLSVMRQAGLVSSPQ